MREDTTATPNPASSTPGLSVAAKSYLSLTLALGLGVSVTAFVDWPNSNWLRFAFYVAVACLASGLKVRLPGMEATLSVNFFFTLLAAVELGFSEAVAVGGLCAFMQIYWRPDHRPEPIQVPFNFSTFAISSAAASLVFNSAWAHQLGLELVPRIALAATAQFCANSILVSGIIALTQNKKLLPTLGGMFWSFPYYFTGGLAVALFHSLSLYVGWQSALLALPATYLVYRSYQIYLDRLEAQRRHAQQMSDLQFRTIQALALAIECKDETTHEHLGRVQVYAIEVAKELGLTADEMEALRAASLLHDIGKLAVPEYIINKPGRLTPEEFNKMKIHPTVGAEILSSVEFPYPVVPFVRSHHEKWDGNGYPDGLTGEDIPVGARIIAAVDCLDALASDRQYRRALPLDDAMEIVRKEAGKSFDPRIVDILSRRYVEFEQMAKRHSTTSLPKLSLDLQIERGGAPGAGFEQTSRETVSLPTPVESLIALAAVDQRQHGIESLLKLIQDAGPLLGLEELVVLAAVRLSRLIPHDGLAAYKVHDKTLHPVYVTGEDAKLFLSLQIPLGQGVSGWVAETRRSIVNGNPSVEAGYLGNPAKYTSLRSAVSATIESGSRVAGVLTLYALAGNAFTADDRRVVEAIGSGIGRVLAGPTASPVSAAATTPPAAA